MVQKKVQNTANISPMEWLEKAHILTEALPFMQCYDRKMVVIKYGGHAMGDASLAKLFARDVVLLKQAGIHPIIIHGGGPQISEMLQKIGIESHFSNGLRVTGAETVKIVEMVLSGLVNKEIVTSINQAGGQAIGLSGKDSNLLMAEKITSDKKVDLGFVGKPTKVNAKVLETLNHAGIIPVIAPIAISESGETLNVNADMVAGAIAVALQAIRLLFLTDIAGLLDKEGNLVKRLNILEVKNFIKEGVVTGGMIPKLEVAIQAKEQGVDAIAILDGRVPHALLLELLTMMGNGTLIG